MNSLAEVLRKETNAGSRQYHNLAMFSFFCGLTMMPIFFTQFLFYHYAFCHITAGGPPNIIRLHKI